MQSFKNLKNNQFLFFRFDIPYSSHVEIYMRAKSMNTPSHITILRMADVIRRIKLSRSAIYDKLNKSSRRYDPEFPKQVPLLTSSLGCIQDEINAWLELQISKSRGSFQ